MSDSGKPGEWRTVFAARITGNTQFLFGVKSESLSELLSNFQISQEYLYHYTRIEVAESIAGGKIWLTRADDFLDQAEIDYGLSMLTASITDGLDSQMADSYRELLGGLRDVLRECYVLSLSQDPHNDYLTENYSYDDGAILRLPSDFFFALRSGWHAVPAGDGFSLHYVSDLYEQIHGFVVYDLNEQQRISSIAIEAYKAISSNQDESSPESIVEILHLRDALLQCLILFKEPRYIEEREYRMALVSRSDEENQFEHLREIKNRKSRYIKLRMPAGYIENGLKISSVT